MEAQTMTLVEQAALFPPYALEKSFTPHKPIQLRDQIAGRIGLIQRAMDSLNTEGLQPMLYGERGVGKTSVARVLAVIAEDPARTNGVRSIYVVCDSATSFASAWASVAAEVPV